jgi:hypothetical protein
MGMLEEAFPGDGFSIVSKGRDRQFHNCFKLAFSKWHLNRQRIALLGPHDLLAVFVRNETGSWN